jgi:succinyl-CoA synthetase alpha subunit
MAVLVNKSTRVICQGFTGSQSTFPSEEVIGHKSLILATGAKA